MDGEEDLFLCHSPLRIVEFCGMVVRHCWRFILEAYDMDGNNWKMLQCKRYRKVIYVLEVHVLCTMIN